MDHESFSVKGFAHDGVRFVRNPHFIFRRIVDEAVLVPIHQQVADMRCIYTLNDAGALVWERLDRPATQAELLRAILDEYDACLETASRDLGDFLQGMIRIDAIRQIEAIRRIDTIREP